MQLCETSNAYKQSNIEQATDSFLRDQSMKTSSSFEPAKNATSCAQSSLSGQGRKARVIMEVLKVYQFGKNAPSCDQLRVQAASSGQGYNSAQSTTTSSSIERAKHNFA
jgi:hypothetical protein